ncbi:MAG: hypothetical protein C0402_10620 [Thermodesulfovibrio sp.]|nr:hypothetical protein [Thermodesulfovibrio sp.]
MMNCRDLKQRLHAWLTGLDELPGLYVVGGTVRDLLSDKAPADIDIVCHGAKVVAGRLAALHHAALVVMQKKPHQPCYRVVDRQDSADYLDIAELRGPTIEEDLRQRDFTINAMAMKIDRNFSFSMVIDPFGGERDLKQKSIRMTNSGVFTDDPLRVLRAFRFAAEGFEIEAATMQALASSSALLAQVSVERIMAELFLIFRTAQSCRIITALDGHGILGQLFPEILPMKGCLQNGYHHKDVWGHSLLVLEQVEHILNHLEDYFCETSAAVCQNLGTGERSSLLKCAALFHDIGKPSTKGLKQGTGRISFTNHDQAGAELMTLIAERMKLSNQAQTFLVRLVKEHLQPLFLSVEGVTVAARMRWFRKMGDEVIPALILSMADVMSSRGPESGEEYRQNFVSWCAQMARDYFASIRKILERPRLITGHDLIELGMEPGPGMGEVLDQVSEAQDNGAVTSRDEALAYARELLMP